MKTKLLCVALSLASISLLSACSQNNDIEVAEIENIVNATQTKEAERTVEWYKKNDFVRNDVIAKCMQLVENKITENNALGIEYKYETIEQQVNKNKDCLNARQANINLEAELDKSRITYDEYNRRLRSYEAAQANASKLTPEELEAAKKQMDSALESMDKNEIGRTGDEQFNKIRDMVDSEIETGNAKAD
jgi:hypothetical protein